MIFDEFCAADMQVIKDMDAEGASSIVQAMASTKDGTRPVDSVLLYCRTGRTPYLFCGRLHAQGEPGHLEATQSVWYSLPLCVVLDPFPLLHVRALRSSTLLRSSLVWGVEFAPDCIRVALQRLFALFLLDVA